MIMHVYNAPTSNFSPYNELYGSNDSCLLCSALFSCMRYHYPLVEAIIICLCELTLLSSGVIITI